MSDEYEVTEDESEQEGEYRPTRGVLSQEDYEGTYQEESSEDE